MAQKQQSSIQFDLFGQVQGVGLRPFLFRLASQHGLKGQIFNHQEGASCLLEGAQAQLEAFAAGLITDAKPPIQIREVRQSPSVLQNFTDLKIVASHSTTHTAQLCLQPDAITCDQCWSDFHNVAHRMYRYPFISCADCGPRWSILSALPFERQNTSLVDFPLCGDCQTDYTSPQSRRFHAQTISCPSCGPHLTLWSAKQSSADTSPTAASTLNTVQKTLRAGAIGLVKGIGGFQLVGDATNLQAIARIRKLKNRPSQALAIMVANFDQFSALAGDLGGDLTAWQQLTRPEGPIVSLKLRNLSNETHLAPDLNEIGVMAPTSGLHWWLASAVPALIVTSANRQGEPLARSREECSFSSEVPAIDAPEVDFILDHNRKIFNAIDDSVIRGTQILRKARGFTPKLHAKPKAFGKILSSILALGADMKNATALSSDQHYLELPYGGSLESAKVVERQKEQIKCTVETLKFQPDLVAHDIHPESSTRYLFSDSPSGENSNQLVPHHLAHAYSTRLKLNADLILTFDGTGLNEHGELCGGEGYVQTEGKMDVALTLRPTPLLGGNASIRYPWRSLVSMLASGPNQDQWDAAKLSQLIPDAELNEIELCLQMIKKNLGVPCSSMGRWFDAAAALIDFGAKKIEYEAQAPIRLEALAERYLSTAPHAEPLSSSDCLDRKRRFVTIDGSKILNQLSKVVYDTPEKDRGGLKGYFAFLAHDLMACAVALAIKHISDASPRPLSLVTGSGGVFQNRVFANCLSQHLQSTGFTFELTADLPVNDQAIALGQLIYLDSMNAEVVGIKTCMN
jgi:hydrogenase maturation protein HypF